MTLNCQEQIQDIAPKAFHLGALVVTRGVDDFLKGNHVALIPLLNNHKNGDWGDCCREDAIQNNWATHNGQRILSVYYINGEKVWIITEHDRSVTTVLFPSEY
ncbi:TPA: type I restriction endonuclease subunit M [Photobacterium damselae]